MELIDREKELARLNKEKAKAEKELAMFENQLANPKFVERAPAAVSYTHLRKISRISMVRSMTSMPPSVVEMLRIWLPVSSPSNTAQDVYKRQGDIWYYKSIRKGEMCQEKIL